MRAEIRFQRLLPETWLYGDALASLSTTAGNHRPAALGLHTRTKSVRLRPATTVRLECALRHSKLRSSLAKNSIGQTKSIPFGLPDCKRSDLSARPLCLGRSIKRRARHVALLVQQSNRIAICTMHAAANFFFATNIHEINHSQRL